MSCAAFIIVRCGLTQADLTTVEMKNGTKTFMSLMLSYIDGYIVADLDIELEWFQILNPWRKPVCHWRAEIDYPAIDCIHPGRLSYLLLEESPEESHTLMEESKYIETRGEVASETQEVKVSQNNSCQEHATDLPSHRSSSPSF